ncbi:phospholipid-binding protein [Alcanivorax sp. HI0033]|uniref:BON domain-containing protein n=1 Tax=unclassified Alcanivorax TaxID=2638842 RepID=UPI0007BA1F17|nr:MULTISPECIES: BON domain-containing protein [unclassified Alcanivorax]KZX74760.1 phospholipid-binding protein [Alcanivorax sp. HI0011]KZX83570.1 phospholipid-binding protein [Alcanivorax sp. HI0013]KZY14680.1 phospholipid-binding protein [Alcanivorax sp. HI0035]KZX68217.1 phospholipid-binding protein [Alcanivorax sp. HI0003]KZX68868.1 phospholipid-binding protein [Alcanivorax sp. HI0007]
MAAGFIRFSHVLTMFVLFATVSGCASLSKGMSEEPVDQNHGKRTFGAFIEDGNIERKVAVNLARASAELDESRIVVVSYNGNVLLAGQVANDDLKAQAGNIAEQVRHVRHVHNELQVVGSNSFLARTNDTWLTSKVKSRLLINGEAPGWRTKVVTENGVVYLMGLLTHEEADAVVEQVQKVYGVQKIVKIIEYID